MGFLELQQEPGVYSRVTAGMAIKNYTSFSEVRIAAVLNGYCEKDTEITVLLRGGTLKIKVTDDAVYMSGNAVTVFSGEITI